MPERTEPRLWYFTDRGAVLEHEPSTTQQRLEKGLWWIWLIRRVDKQATADLHRHVLIHHSLCAYSIHSDGRRLGLYSRRDDRAGGRMCVRNF